MAQTCELGPSGTYNSKQRANCQSGMPVATFRRSTRHPTVADCASAQLGREGWARRSINPPAAIEGQSGAQWPSRQRRERAQRSMSKSVSDDVADRTRLTD
jgi:hypothetical protein